MWKLLVNLCVGQNEDYSPGYGTSDSSEKLLQRGEQWGVVGGGVGQ